MKKIAMMVMVVAALTASAQVVEWSFDRPAGAVDLSFDATNGVFYAVVARDAAAWTHSVGAHLDATNTHRATLRVEPEPGAQVLLYLVAQVPRLVPSQVPATGDPIGSRVFTATNAGDYAFRSEGAVWQVDAPEGVYLLGTNDVLTVHAGASENVFFIPFGASFSSRQRVGTERSLSRQVTTSMSLKSERATASFPSELMPESVKVSK